MTKDSKPVLRFAPSPTGYLHIGGARTALFNWLYAKRHGGTFLLRIEDTDRERSTPEAMEAILKGMEWLGLNWDGQTVYQFARADRHRAVAEQLLVEGKAYRCYATPAELDEMRAKQRAEGKPIRYDGRWRDRDPSEAPAGAPFVIRLRAQQEGETIVHDKVQGDVRFANDQLDDMILLRSDGTPTYMLAVVVDDNDMGVTHVIRGADHLNNAARQLQIIHAMDWSIPVYAHVPLIHGPDGAKLSKRHGALAVDEYRKMGYLPEAMRNYLLRLGWSHGDDEFIPTAQAIEWFNLENIGKSPARFDFKKLDNLNGQYIRSMDDATLADEVADFLAREEPPRHLDARAKERLKAAMPGLKERAKTLIELSQGAEFLYTDGVRQLDDAAKKALNVQINLVEGADTMSASLSTSPDPKDVLKGLVEALSKQEWKAADLETATRGFAEAQGLKLGQAAQPLRAALTGRTVSPPIFEMLQILGREESLTRLKAYTT